MIISAKDLPITAYHKAAPAWFSKTSLRYFKDNGAPWFRLFLDGLVEPKKPGGVEAGNALDCLLTEDGAGFAERFAMKPKSMDGRTSEGKAWAKANEGKEILTESDTAILADAAEAVRTCWAWPQIEKSMAQATVRRHSDSMGFGLQSRPDWLMPSDGIVWDLKKTRDLDRFGGQAIDLGYHLQAATGKWCLAGDGIDMRKAWLVAVEWERGARCRVYEIPSDVLDHADREMRAIAADIADRFQRNDWIDHQEQGEPLPVPDWMRRKMEAA